MADLEYLRANALKMLEKHPEYVWCRERAEEARSLDLYDIEAQMEISMANMREAAIRPFVNNRTHMYQTNHKEI